MALSNDQKVCEARFLPWSESEMTSSSPAHASDRYILGWWSRIETITLVSELRFVDLCFCFPSWDTKQAGTPCLNVVLENETDQILTSTPPISLPLSSR